MTLIGKDFYRVGACLGLRSFVSLFVCGVDTIEEYLSCWKLRILFRKLFPGAIQVDVEVDFDEK